MYRKQPYVPQRRSYAFARKQVYVKPQTFFKNRFASSTKAVVYRKPYVRSNSYTPMSAASKIQSWWRNKKKWKFNTSKNKGSFAFQKKVMNTMNDLIPWRAASAERGYRINIGTTGTTAYNGFTQGVNATAEGQGAWLDGLSNPIADITYLTQELLNIDLVGNPATKNFKIEIDYMSTVLELMNNSNTKVFLSVYWAAPRKANTQTGSIGIGPSWATAIGSTFDNLTMTHGIKPTDSSAFCTNWLITKSKTYSMEPGEAKTIRIPNYMFKNKTYSTIELMNTGNSDKFSRGVLFFLRGVPSHPNGDANLTTVSSSGGYLSIINKQRMKARVLERDYNVFTQQSNLDNAVPTTYTAGVGPNNPPQPYKTTPAIIT